MANHSATKKIPARRKTQGQKQVLWQNNRNAIRDLKAVKGKEATGPCSPGYKYD
ncbi:MAG: hypothetical protein WDO19_06470 [Bacteroidota bacterium]